MDIQHRNWDEEYKSRGNLKPEYDLWLDKHSRILGESSGAPIVDLGCGLGNDSLYLAERGFTVIACDISREAVSRASLLHPNISGICFDILQGLPFDDSSKKIILSDLSLHYFSWSDTLRIVSEIKRVLMPGGYLLCRLNSTKDDNYGAGHGKEIEENYYVVEGNTKRFFDRKEIEKLFCGWEIPYLNEYEIYRFQYPKVLWEAVIKLPC